QQRVGAGERRVGHEHTAVGAHRKSFPDRVPGTLWAHRDEDHLAPVRLLELQALFDAALVAGVEDRLLVAGDCVVALEGEIRVGIWNLFDGDDDLQWAPAIIAAPKIRHGSARARAAS